MSDFFEKYEQAKTSKVEQPKDVDNAPTGDPVVDPKHEEVKPPDYSEHVKAISGVLGEELDSVDVLKGYFDKGKQYDTLLNEKEEIARRVDELNEKIKPIDPLSFFADEDEYKRQQFLIKNKDMDENVLSAVKNLSPSKIDKLNPLEALKLQLLVNNPDIEGGDAGIEELLADKYGIDVEDMKDFDHLNVIQRNKLNLAAKEAKGDLKNLYKDINLPEKVDVAKEIEVTKQSWERPLKEIVNGIDKLTIADGYDFVVTEDMKQGLYDTYLNSLSNNLAKPNTEVGAKIAGEIRTQLLVRNMDNVVKFIEKQVEERVKEATRQELHNAKPLNNYTPPPDGQVKKISDIL